MLLTEAKYIVHVLVLSLVELHSLTSGLSDHCETNHHFIHTVLLPNHALLV